MTIEIFLNLRIYWKIRKNEYDDAFDTDKNRKFNKIKKFELTEFYMLNDDLEFKKIMKKHKKILY